MSTSSGESILDRWFRNCDFHGAAPTLAGVVAAVDIVRTMRNRRELAEEAILNVCYYLHLIITIKSSRVFDLESILSW